MFARFSRPADDAVHERAALTAFTTTPMPLDQDQDGGASAGTAANGARAATLTLELMAYRAGDKASERLILRDVRGAQQQVIYDAQTLDQGHLLDALALLVQQLRRQVMPAVEGEEEGEGEGAPDRQGL